MDTKGRVVVPAVWRDRLLESEGIKGQLILTKDPAGCLGLYPPPAFAQLEAALETLGGEDADWSRLYLGNAQDLEIDGASRILLTPELRRWAGMKDGEPIMFMGVGAYFELWDSTRHDANEAQAIARGKPEALRKLVIR